MPIFLIFFIISTAWSEQGHRNPKQEMRTAVKKLNTIKASQSFACRAGTATATVDADTMKTSQTKVAESVDIDFQLDELDKLTQSLRPPLRNAEQLCADMPIWFVPDKDAKGNIVPALSNIMKDQLTNRDEL